MRIPTSLFAVATLAFGASTASANHFEIVDNGLRQRAVVHTDALGNTTTYTGFSSLRPAQLRRVMSQNLLTDSAAPQPFGQLEAISPVSFNRHVVAMSPALVPSGSTSNAFGTLVAYTIETDLGHKFFMAANVFNIVPTDLDLTHGPNNTAYHVHRGFPGSPGPILIDFNFIGDEVETTTGMVSYAAGEISTTQGAYTVPFTASEILDFIRTGEAFVAFHTVANPSGDIRGNF